jgi:hypothetical protein
MTGHGAKFPRKKEEAIAALLTHPNREIAAQALGISSKTLQRWFHIPEFQQAYQKARQDHFAQLGVQFQQDCPLALGTLLKAMTDKDSTSAIRLRAAISTVEFAVQAVALEALQARVQQLEQQQPEAPSSAPPRPRPVEAIRRSPCHGAKHGGKKGDAIAALLKEPTIEQAARAVSIDPKTLRRWLQTPEFEDAYSKARADKFSLLTEMFQKSCFAARTTLHNLLMDPQAPKATKIRAAVFVLHCGGQAWKQDLEVQLQRLEQPHQDSVGKNSPEDSGQAA